jgi:flagellar biosynthesis protein FliR
MFMGVGGMPGTPIEDTETEAPVSTLITLTATTMLFITDQHWEILRGLAASYAVMPINEPFSPRFGLIQITDVLADAFIITLQLSSPFLIYSALINFLFGLVNKMTPAIPVFFISLPFTIAGGFLLLYFTIDELLDLFMTAFAGWLLKG